MEQTGGISPVSFQCAKDSEWIFACPDRTHCVISSILGVRSGVCPIAEATTNMAGILLHKRIDRSCMGGLPRAGGSINRSLVVLVLSSGRALPTRSSHGGTRHTRSDATRPLRTCGFAAPPNRYARKDPHIRSRGELAPVDGIQGGAAGGGRQPCCARHAAPEGSPASRMHHHSAHLWPPFGT